MYQRHATLWESPIFKEIRMKNNVLTLQIANYLVEVVNDVWHASICLLYKCCFFFDDHLFFCLSLRISKQVNCVCLDSDWDNIFINLFELLWFVFVVYSKSALNCIKYCLIVCEQKILREFRQRNRQKCYLNR